MGKLPTTIDVSWHPFMSHCLETDILKKLNYQTLNQCTFYPKAQDIFNVFSMPIHQIRVVILGQDPYPQPQQAIGYAFAVSSETSMPASLRIIRKEVFNQVEHQLLETDDWKTLQHWRDQGVFLLNTALTVEHGKAGSHMHYWEDFTKHILQTIASQVQPIWLLWGLHAQKYENVIKMALPNNYGTILKAPHPAAEVYNNGKAGFYGSNHFQKTNQLLINNQINW